MAKRAKASESSEPEREVGLVNVDDSSPSSDPLPQAEARPALPPPPPRVPPEAPPHTPTGPSFGDRVGSFFRFLLRLVLLLIFLGLLSIALYLALPWFYDRFIRPVERNAAQVQELQSVQTQTEQQLADLQTKLETLENVQNEQDESLTEMAQRLSDIETEIAARTESLAALERLQSELEEQNQVISSELKREIDLLKAMELLSRARLSLYQSNFGLAREDVQIARDILSGIEPSDSEADTENLDAVIFRLDMTLSNLPDFPVAASDDLDIAWQILLTGLPEATPNATTTPTPSAANMTVTPTPGAADMTITPTPRGTLQPSATP